MARHARFQRPSNVRHAVVGVCALGAFVVLMGSAIGQPADESRPPGDESRGPDEAPPAGGDRPDAARTAKQRALSLVSQGADLFEQNRRLEAVAKFEEAYALYPATAILFNLGEAYRSVGRNAAAHRAFAAFLEESDFPDEMRRRQAERALHVLEPMVGRLIISAPYRDGASVFVDKDQVGLAPLPHAIAVEPGVHEVSAMVGNKEVVYEQISVAAGELTKVKLWRARGQAVALPHLRRPDDEPPAGLFGEQRAPAPARKPLYERWWVWTAVGAVAAGSVALYLSLRGDTVNDVDPTFGRFPFDEF